MHDWSLISIAVDWKSGTAQLELQGPVQPASLRCFNVRGLRVPRTMPWGPSNLIMQMHEPVRRENNVFELSIEMQSGDVIVIAAEAFDLPSSQR